MKPETLKRIEAQADADAEQHARTVGAVEFGVMGAYTNTTAIGDALRAAFLRGADAGYTAAKAEERDS